MAKYWSATEAAFYDTDIVGENGLPEDSVLITDAEYSELMSHQCGGCVIVNGTNNRPVAMQQVCQPCTCITHEETVATATQLGHVKIGDGITVEQDGTISADIPAEMVGATASADGQAGIVPAPAAGDQAKYLTGAGGWSDITNALVIGTVYVQFAGQSAPADLYGGIWENISANYAGQFFRAEGRNAAEFGSWQDGGAPNIWGGVQTGHSLGLFGGPFEGAVYAHEVYGGSQAASSGSYSKGFRFSASIVDSRYSLSEFRPFNSTVRIWKRIG